MKFSVAEINILHDNTSGSTDIIIATLELALGILSRGH